MERVEAVERIDALLAGVGRLSELQRFQLARLREMVLQCGQRPHMVRSLVRTCEFIAARAE